MAAGNTYTTIDSNTLSSATSSVTFSSIGSGYTDLVLVMFIKSATTNNPTIQMRFNGDTGSNYGANQLYTNSSTSGALGYNQNTSSNHMPIFRNGISATVGDTNGLISNIFTYTGSTFKTVLTNSVNPNSSGMIEYNTSIWSSTAAITSINVFSATTNDFAVGSTFALYGILAA